MTQPTPLDHAAAQPPARRLLGHLTGVLPRRGGRPTSASPDRPAEPGRPTDVPPDDAFWWEVVRGTAPLGGLASTVPAPTSTEPLASSAPAGPAARGVGATATVPGAVPLERPSLARAEGWLHARAGAVAAEAAAPAVATSPPLATPPAVATPPPVATPPSVATEPAVATEPVASPPSVATEPAVAHSPSAAVPDTGAPGRRRPRHLAPSVPSQRDGTSVPELALEDGRRVPLTTTLLVGRNPAPRGGEVVGALVAVEDPARSVSKTHLLVGFDASGVWVVDRHSTNGTVVTLPDGQRILAVPERRVRLVSGAGVRFGDHGFTLVGGDDRA